MQRYDPFREVLSLRDVMDRLFQESFIRPSGLPGALAMGVRMPVDIHETEDAYVCTASLPGWKPADIAVTVQGDTLTISGQHTPEEGAEQGKTYHVRERAVASFSRSFTLPTPVDADKATATYEHGELVLTLPKAASARPKQIKISGQA